MVIKQPIIDYEVPKSSGYEPKIRRIRVRRSESANLVIFVEGETFHAELTFRYPQDRDEFARLYNKSLAKTEDEEGLKIIIDGLDGNGIRDLIKFLAVRRYIKMADGMKLRDKLPPMREPETPDKR